MNKELKLYCEPVAEFIGNLVCMYQRIKDYDIALDDEDCKCYYQICDWINDLYLTKENYENERYKNDIYDDIEKAIDIADDSIRLIHDTDTLMDSLARLKLHRWVSWLSKAISWLDDTWLYLFDETYNTYSNFWYDTVKNLIINILSWLDYDYKFLYN